MTELIGHGIRLFLAVAAFGLPGFLAHRRWPSPAPFITGFFVSALLWFYLVLAFDALGIPLAEWSLMIAWCVVCTGLFILARKTRTAPPSSPFAATFPKGGEWIWIAAATLGLASITLRAVIDPLSGWDNGFRWDYLARALVAHQRLDFYPAVRPADFEIYGWCDGIPPLVPLLNAWLYLFSGTYASSVTAARVVVEALLIGTAVYKLSCELWGRKAGWPAVGMLGSSALLLWGIAMGQETALLAVAIVTMCLFLERNFRAPDPGLLSWAGLSAGVAALTRDYGIAFTVVGTAFLAWPARSRRDALRFGLIAAAVASPWYIRNGIKTGNPLFPHTLGGLLPSNSIYTEMMASISQYWNWNSTHLAWGQVALTIFILGHIVILGAAVGVLQRRRLGLPAIAILTVVGLWLWSIPQTAGGINYSLRVLSPALILAAALSGWVANVKSVLGRTLLGALCTIAAIDAGRRAWLLPMAPTTSAIPPSFRPWKLGYDATEASKQNPLWDYLVSTAGGSKIAVDNPASHAELIFRGGHPAMIFSPIFLPCMDDHAPFEDSLASIRAAGVRLVVLTRNNPVANSYLMTHSFFATLAATCRPVLQVEAVTVYDLEQLPAKNR